MAETQGVVEVVVRTGRCLNDVLSWETLTAQMHTGWTPRDLIRACGADPDFTTMSFGPMELEEWHPLLPQITRHQYSSDIVTLPLVFEIRFDAIVMSKGKGKGKGELKGNVVRGEASVTITSVVDHL